jgi:L-fuconolactonase
MKLDAHHHLWRYDPDEYAWIDPSMTVLRRDYLVPELRAVTQASGVDHVISVQARQTVEETRWLLELATAHELIAGVVGWVPLSAPDVGVVLSELATQPKLRGVRHVLQDEADERYMLRPEFNRGIRALAAHDLTYDLLIFERQLPPTMAFVDRHPHQRFVLDHVAKPRIREHLLSPWSENLRELARRPNVWCKLSGLTTEADPSNWTEAELKPYLEVAMETFGPQRLMFGSDWPVCLLGCNYDRWIEVVDRVVARWSADEQEQFWWKNAFNAYGLT